MRGLWWICLGYRRCRLPSEREGLFLRMMKKAAHEGIALKNIRKREDGFYFEVCEADYPVLADFVRKTGEEPVTVKKSGFHRRLVRLLHRRAFLFGFLLLAVIPCLMSRHVWEITLEGSFSHTEQEMVAFLAEHGIQHGIRKSQVSCQEIEQLIRSSFSDISWVSAELSGTRLILHLKENFDSSVEEAEEEPYSFAAKCDAIVTRVVCRSGTRMIREGDTVKKGDLLIAGRYQIFDTYGSLLYEKQVKADGEVYGITTRSYRETFSLRYVKKAYTGRRATRLIVNIGRQGYSLGIGGKDYVCEDSWYEVQRARLFSNFYLPLEFGTKTIAEYEPVEAVYTEEEARALAEKKLHYFFQGLEEKGVQILEKDGTIQIHDEVCVISYTITCEESLLQVVPVSEAAPDAS